MALSEIEWFSDQKRDVVVHIFDCECKTTCLCNYTGKYRRLMKLIVLKSKSVWE